MNSKNKKRMSIFALIVGTIFLIELIDFATSEIFTTYPKDLAQDELRTKNRYLTREINAHKEKIEQLEDSVKQYDLIITAYKDHIPTVKTSLSDLQHRKKQAVIDNDFAGYVSQDSIYMDTVSGLIAIYDSLIESHEMKEKTQDSIIKNYKESADLVSKLHVNEVELIKNEHQIELDKLNRKIKRIKRQRNLSLGLNAILTVIIFWKK